jgi:AAA+ superfamily predicted ATPase
LECHDDYRSVPDEAHRMPADPFENLREAVRQSPQNVPLRQHLADSLLERGRADEAETEFRRALTIEPANAALKLGLARAFYRQGKDSEAFVVLEQLVKPGNAAPAARVLFARLLFKTGDVASAVAQYKAAVEDDPDEADREFADRLGIRDVAAPADDEDELVDGRLRASREGAGGIALPEIERPNVRFDDVGGMEALKEEIRLKIIYPLQHAEMYKAYGKSIGGGILMYGPPGCGKTHLARATAGEVQAGFIAVGINDVLDMWIGSSERSLHEIFEQARRSAPCVLFFDEVDALGARRADLRQSAGRHLINQFLAELDGVQTKNDGLLVLAATNAPWHVDPAFRRPGRFDRVLFVPPPDTVARESILRIMLKGKPAEDIDYHAIAAKSEQYSGADLKAIVDLAVEAKLQEAMKAGGLRPLVTKDLQRALKTHRATTSEWFSTARNHALYANQGGVYDDVLAYLKIR